MKFITFSHPPSLPKRWGKLFKGRMAGLALQGTADERASYIKARGSWNVLKGWLSSVSHNKCWYCEAKSDRAPLDVDHFRPKLSITIDGLVLQGHTGYYWLSYDWSNFRLSCQRCNRPERDEQNLLRGKANEFPLHDEGQRCTDAGGLISLERPRLLDPCSEDDCELLAYGLDGEVKPSAINGSWGYQRANYTIQQLGLNAFNAPESRRKSWSVLSTLIRISGEQPEVIAQVRMHLSAEQEYLSFFKSAIGSHRDKPWIEALM